MSRTRQPSEPSAGPERNSLRRRWRRLRDWVSRWTLGNSIIIYRVDDDPKSSLPDPPQRSETFLPRDATPPPP